MAEWSNHLLLANAQLGGNGPRAVLFLTQTAFSILQVQKL